MLTFADQESVSAGRSTRRGIVVVLGALTPLLLPTEQAP
jgi:hypothetical protein